MPYYGSQTFTPYGYDTDQREVSYVRLRYVVSPYRTSPYYGTLDTLHPIGGTVLFAITCSVWHRSDTFTPSSVSDELVNDRLRVRDTGPVAGKIDPDDG
jgi:hypothetical protein